MNQQETEEYISRMYLIKDRMIVRKCGKYDDLGDGSRGIDLGDGKVLELPTDYYEQTNFCELIDIGDECKFFTKDMCARSRGWEDGETVWVPEQNNYIQPVGDKKLEYWFCRESICPPFCMVGNEIRPLKDMVVVELPTQEFESGVRLTDARVDYAGNEGILVAVGPEAPKGCDIGDRVALDRKYDMHRFRISEKQFGICKRNAIVGVYA